MQVLCELLMGAKFVVFCNCFFFLLSIFGSCSYFLGLLFGVHLGIMLLQTIEKNSNYLGSEMTRG